MFENIIAQPIVSRLKEDIANKTLPPSLLFEGPAFSAKNSTALEMARYFSCEQGNALWNCKCPSCTRHRLLSHTDLLVMGPRNFSQEIAAALSAWTRENNLATRTLFFRSVKKLLLRFSAVLWTDDPKIVKINPILESVNEGLEDFLVLTVPFIENTDSNIENKIDEKQKTKLAKLCASLVKQTLKAESEGVSEMIPVLQVRNAATWLRLTPLGRRKLLIIENADCMHDHARNSLLKILEEPPAASSIILTTTKSQKILPTILSRLRRYTFANRTAEQQGDVIRRIFKDTPPETSENPISFYMDTFVSLPKDSVYNTSIVFWAALSGIILNETKKGVLRENKIMLLNKINTYSSGFIQNSGLENTAYNVPSLCAVIMQKTDKFEMRGVFSLFLKSIYSVFSDCTRDYTPVFDVIIIRETIQKCIKNAYTAANIFNLNKVSVLENFILSIKQDIIQSE